MTETRRAKRLGRGLGALIPKSPADQPADRQLALDEILPNPWQPRERFDEAEIDELAASIRSHGVIQPLVVRPVEEGYQLVTGERRLRAARKVGLDAVPVVLKEMTDREALEVTLVENLQREDLSPLEEARAYQRLLDDFGLNQDQVAERVGKSRPAVANTLRLLLLPEAVRLCLDEGTITAGHARALLGVTGRSAQTSLLRDAVRRGLSVRELEEKIRRLREGPRTTGRPKRSRDVHVADLEQELSRRLATRVRLVPKGRGGRIVIEYYSGDELDRLLGVLRSPRATQK